MNLNEVIANRASELARGTRGEKQPIHPNDHVNRGQPGNDTVPTAMHVSAALELRGRLFPALGHLAETLAGKAETYRDVVKKGVLTSCSRSRA